MAKFPKEVKARSGKPVNVYLGDTDISRIRQLGAWLAGKGYRVSDSQVIKAAIIAIKPGKSLLDAFNEVLESDLRFRRH